jgi:hypothetical protein
MLYGTQLEKKKNVRKNTKLNFLLKREKKDFAIFLVLLQFLSTDLFFSSSYPHCFTARQKMAILHLIL